MKLMGRYSKYWPFQQPGPLFRFCIIALSRLTLKVATPATSQFWLPKYQTGQVCQWRVESGKLLRQQKTRFLQRNSMWAGHVIPSVCCATVFSTSWHRKQDALQPPKATHFNFCRCCCCWIIYKSVWLTRDPIQSSLPLYSLPGEKIVFMSTRIYTKLPSIHWLSPSPKRSALPWLEAFGPWNNSMNQMKHFDHLYITLHWNNKALPGIASKFRMPLGMGRCVSMLFGAQQISIAWAYICLPLPKQAVSLARNVILAAATLIFVQLVGARTVAAPFRLLFHTPAVIISDLVWDVWDVMPSGADGAAGAAVTMPKQLASADQCHGFG